MEYGGNITVAKNIKVIIGSTRENRLGADVASWVAKVASSVEGISVQIIDLQAENLPMFNAPVSPAYMPQDTPEAKAWGEKITNSDGFIFVTPEYNRSIPASLKNAIDYLYKEWADKTAVIVSYGFVDGGVTANKHLDDILKSLAISVVGNYILHLSHDDVDQNGKFSDVYSALAKHVNPLTEELKKLQA